jgi:uncharacterized protein DUF6894
MPRFHFDLREDDVFMRDDEGAELVDDKAAERQAIETAASVARDAFARGSAEKVLVEVRDHRAATLFKVAVLLKIERGD